MVRAPLSGQSTVCRFDHPWFSFLCSKRLCISSLCGAIYRVSQNKISQHENSHVSEMHEYFCTKFRSFVWQKTAPMYCFMRQLDGSATVRTNFTIEQKVDFIIIVTE